MKTTYFLLSIVLFVSCQSEQNSNEDELTEHPFVHTAYFWFTPGLSLDEKESFIRDCEKLREVETVQAFYSGGPANTNRAVIENTYDYAVVFHFKDLEDQEYYQQHPLHLSMIEKHQDKWAKVMVTDIEH